MEHCVPRNNIILHFGGFMQHVLKYLNDYRMIFTDNCVIYQDTKKKGLFSKELVVLNEYRISYRNIDYIEYEPIETSPGIYTGVHVLIQLINPQPEFNTLTLRASFSGVFIGNELSSMFSEIRSKLN